MTRDLASPTSVPDPAAALAALEAAEPLLANVEADNERLAQAYAVLVSAVDRARPLADYYGGDWLAHVDAVVEVDSDAASDTPPITPRTASQDAIWEALAEHDEWLRRILRLAADTVTRDVGGV
ncbi:MAG: hypothetical protein V9F04_07985 [Dermatophilaceae bacterium]